MFEQTFVEGKTKKTWTALIAFIAQICLDDRRVSSCR